MVTKVGLQGDFASALKDLIELDFDAIEAYEAAINRLEKAEYKAKLTAFKGDHENHVRDVTQLLQQRQIEAPTGPCGKQWLTKGKVILANMMGDEAILGAMLSNEQDTNTAYERMNSHDDKWPESATILMRGLADEKKHKAWLEAVLKK